MLRFSAFHRLRSPSGFFEPFDGLVMKALSAGDVQVGSGLFSFNGVMLLRGIYAEADGGDVYERGELSKGPPWGNDFIILFLVYIWR